MALVVFGDGDDILAAEIEANWEACRTVINAQNTNTIRRKVFGPQHLPSLLAERSSGLNQPRSVITLGTGTETIVDAVFTAQSDSDIRTNWKSMLLLDGTAAAGYAIPSGCIVLIWCTGTVRRFSSSATHGDRAHFALTAKVNGASEACIDSTDMGFVFADEHNYSVDLDEFYYEGNPFSFFSILDHSSSGFTLNALRLRAAMDDHDWYMGKAELGFVTIARADESG